MFNEGDLSVIHKQVLLRLCVREIAHWLDCEVSAKDVQDVLDEFRVRRGLISPEQMTEWMQNQDLTQEVLVRAMFDCALANKIEQLWDWEIAQEVPDHIRINSPREIRTNKLAGMVRVEERVSWLQVNVELERRQGEASQNARALFSRLVPVVATWRQQGCLKCFFFVRKLPDLRLRFLTQSLEAQLLDELEKTLAMLQRDGYVRRYFPSVYEPEFHQFGGVDAMQAVHDYFEADSLAWIALDQLAAVGRRTLSAEITALAVMNDLFLSTLACPFEVWDVWCNLANLVSPVQEGHSFGIDAVSIDALVPQVPTEEARILEDYQTANEHLAARLLQIWNDGSLESGIRAILPFIAMFHFNRHGLAGEVTALLASEMCQAWNPKRSMRGAARTPLSSHADHHLAAE